MVAGTAPSAEMISSTRAAMAALSGQGMPWVTIVLSSATTGRPAASAAATGAWTSIWARADSGVMASLLPAVFVAAGRRDAS